ncbi:odorant receptor 49b-like isoform X2 [Cylas formicarius]|uniref:odorant receptor 49b-like isoform X2 n=1 Tax=Cylas formicarius TaxID=197179 RepID=UPI0029584EF8|nr:odorant receptor 49b-like isoform X2 [Cylas formicarius]
MVIGIWKVESPDASVFGKRIYQVYSLSFQLFCYSAALSLLVEIPSLVKTDVAIAMDNANKFLVYIVIIIKMIAWQSRRMVNLLRVLLEQNRQLQKASRTELHIRRLYRKHARYNHNLMLVLVTSGTVIAISIATVGGVNLYHFVNSPDNINATEKPLPYRYWYPFDPSKYYLVALVDQNIRPTFSCFCIGVTSASLNSLAIFVSVQLKVLQHQFEHFNRQEQEALDCLKLLCEKHQRLIVYTTEFSESFKYIVMLDYTVCSLTFALLILQIIAGEELVITFTVLTFTTLQLMTFSWNCNEIILQSMELAKALFNSDWYNQNRHAKILIHVMMMRCQKPLSLRIGWLGVMDLDAGISRLKLGYSYTSIMKN